MKKLIFALLALVFFVSVESKAQFQILKATFNTSTGAVSGIDSAVCANTATVYLYATAVTGLKEYVEVVTNITKVSGTLGGTLTLQGSHDGLVWDTVGSAYTVTDASQVKSLGVAKNANAKKYFRLKWVGTGTMNGYMEATLIAR